MLIAALLTARCQESGVSNEGECEAQPDGAIAAMRRSISSGGTSSMFV
jgi:hypothetical protein